MAVHKTDGVQSDVPTGRDVTPRSYLKERSQGTSKFSSTHVDVSALQMTTKIRNSPRSPLVYATHLTTVLCGIQNVQVLAMLSRGLQRTTRHAGHWQQVLKAHSVPCSAARSCTNSKTSCALRTFCGHFQVKR
jgi:hypothetical protein